MLPCVGPGGESVSRSRILPSILILVIGFVVFHYVYAFLPSTMKPVPVSVFFAFCQIYLPGPRYKTTWARTICQKELHTRPKAGSQGTGCTRGSTLQISVDLEVPISQPFCLRPPLFLLLPHSVPPYPSSKFNRGVFFHM